MHINQLELLVALFALKEFLKGRSQMNFQLKSNNISTVAYNNHIGGTRSQTLVRIAKELWLWCLQRGLTRIFSWRPDPVGGRG